MSDDYPYDIEIYEDDRQQISDEEQQFRDDCAERTRDMKEEMNYAN